MGRIMKTLSAFENVSGRDTKHGTAVYSNPLLQLNDRSAEMGDVIDVVGQ